MSKYEKLITAREPEYDKSFWNYARGNVKETAHLEGGRNFAGAFALPTFHANQCAEAIKELSLFRKIASCAYAAGSENWIAVKDSEEFAVWIPEGGDIPVYDGMYDFTSLKMDYNKLVALVKLDVNLVHDVTFNLQKHLTIRLARNLAKGEDKGFINGTGVGMPVGILCDNGGADVGITTAALTYDDVIGLYFSLKPEYRENGVWLMNAKTALALRTMKDKDGNYLWNQANDTILGKKVYISNEMPDIAAGKKPIAFGAFSFYSIVDRAPISVSVLSEAFSATEQVGYLGHEYLDAKLLRTEAVKVIQVTE